MQPSHIYCKYCGYTLPYVVIPGRGRIDLPADEWGGFYEALKYARAHLNCPKCGNRQWIRKVWWKV